MVRYIKLLLLMVFTPLAIAAQEYRGAEIYSTNSWQYGKIEMRMRMAKGSGILSTFFTYKNGSEISGAFWEEIDIEVFGKDNAESFQSNIITGDPKQYSEGVHDMPFSLADAYHTYTLEWTPNYVAWYVDGVEYRRSEGGQVNDLTNSQSFRMNIWSARDEFWVGPFDTQALPAYQFVNWISYSTYTPGSGDNGTDFTEDWRDDFNSFDANRWARADWTFDANQTPFSPQNVVVKDGYLVLALTEANQTGYTGTVPEDVNVSVQEPYNGTAHTIPGRIEAEEYDLGGEGVAYHEGNANGNEGNANFRADEVDIESTGDTDGEYNIAYTLTGEWLEYTVNVTEAGQYDMSLRLAKDGAGGLLHVELDGVDITGTINVPNTGAWQTYETVTVNDLSLTAGEHIMRIAFDSDYMNLNYVTFSEVLVDSDNDGTADIDDACPNDPNKAATEGDCGCGNPETDTDADGIADCIDTHPNDADNDGVATNEDCNDNDDQVGEATTWYIDADGDGLGSTTTSTAECTQPQGYVDNADDDNDNDFDNDDISSNADCDDNDDQVGEATTWYIDADGDGLGSTTTSTVECTQPQGYVDNTDDANDNDFDNDGISTSNDCDDTDAQVGEATVWYQDLDADGLGKSAVTETSCIQPNGYVSTAGDNNDTDADNDGISTSEDCDDANVSIGSGTTWYLDTDNDGVGDAANTAISCTQPTGFVATPGDECPNDQNKIAPGECGCGATEESCKDCAGIPNGGSELDDCGVCNGNNACLDCNGESNGDAYFDNCNECVGGNTGLEACTQDCYGDWGGTAAEDVCGTCAGGETGITPVTNPQECIATSIDQVLPNDLKVYPNPSQGLVFLSRSSSWKVYNVAGEEMQRGEGSEIDLTSYKEGLYLIKVDGRMYKVVKQ